MPFGRDEKDLAEGAFVPQTDLDKKLFIANEIARNLRQAIWDELQYRASAGISYNKTCAKIASSQNKPNA
jgi:DNA polymerase-4